MPLLLLLASCGDEPDFYIGVHGVNRVEYNVATRLSDFVESQDDAPLKILAIGNSFTTNAAEYLPYLSRKCNADSVCVARLVRSGCSLAMHWKSHVNDSPDYKFYYSDHGEWILTDSVRMDDALTATDWDIIVVQQMSGLAGDYSTYQPTLDYLIRLFHESNPNAKIAWHATWPFTATAVHQDYYRYDNDPKKMYEGILGAAKIASEATDFLLPSTRLIWQLRQLHPEVTDGFSTDGVHITDATVRYALACLWYELLIAPTTGASCLDLQALPSEIDRDLLHEAIDIIRCLCPWSLLRQRHKDTPLKILAVGNSYSLNATHDLPWLAKRINNDDYCIAVLMKPSCTLGMHWENHMKDSRDYTFYYSFDGGWKSIDNATLDEGLLALDWDIIVTQQMSGLSGVYSSYQPSLDQLNALFRKTNPNARLAWHSTWPYTSGTSHKDFYRYGHSPRKMYEAILAASALAAENMDIVLPSTQLIWRMREAYPEVKDGFSDDGIHITDYNALYALTCLWYEKLVRPTLGTTCLKETEFPKGVDGDFLQRAYAIIMDLTGYSNNGYNPDSVEMIYAD